MRKLAVEGYAYNLFKNSLNMKSNYNGSVDYLKEIYPNLEYVDGELFNGNDLIESNADSLIAEYYENFDNMLYDGREYIDRSFGGDYELAFKCI